MASFIENTFNSSNVGGLTRTITAKYFILSPSELTLICTQGNLTKYWPRYGTNASFFCGVGSVVMCAAHAVSNMTIEAATGNTSWVQGGAVNAGDGSASTAWDYMSYKTIAVPGATANVVTNTPRTTPWTPSSGYEYTNWAVGGVNLLMNASCASSAAYTTAMQDYHGGAFSWIPVFSTARARTAIGYRSSDNKIIFGVFYGNDMVNVSDGPKTYELYRIMKYFFNCEQALMLDGGGSSQMRYKKNNVVTTVAGDNRQVNCMLALTQSAASGLGW